MINFCTVALVIWAGVYYNYGNCGGKWRKVDENGDFSPKRVIFMFMGEYQHNIDAKGRVIVPARFREELGERFVVTKGLDKCLFVYPLKEWSRLEEKLKVLPLTSADARKFVRYFFAGAIECEVDAQGRIVLPQNLRAYASLEKHIVSIGVAERVEIWNKDKWETYNDEENFVDNELAAKMAEFGI